ncbi:MAG: PAS domain-containing protein [Legionellaceae bacterium]|nr:PAS domain-containing protein [Legionellaceae bacterium]
MSTHSLHPQLTRLLARTQIQSDDIAQDKQAQWQELLQRISGSYYDHEQGQYLLERSMEISSREMRELNDKLEYAQAIAHLGYWSYHREGDYLVWSKEMYKLSGIDPLQGTPKISQLLRHIHPDDVQNFVDRFHKAFAGETVEIEFQFKNVKDKKYHWHYLKCHPDISKKNSQVCSVSGILIDITERKLYEQKTQKIQDKLLVVSRQAGMAEVATTILHNIGNVLNSANVSLNILKASPVPAYVARLFKTACMIEENRAHLAVFLSDDPKGKLIPDYLVELARVLKNEAEKNVTETQNMDEHLDHIKEIVAMQQIISGSPGILEKIFIPELIDTALKMSVNPEKYHVAVHKEYDDTPFITTNKSKLLQILVNVLQNAQDAVVKNVHEESKTIRIRVKNTQADIRISIIDNGVGIAAEHLARVFAFGFTTKEYGHGFGLHSSALSAKDLGGSLTVASSGMHCGATFTLRIPKRTKKQRQ